MERKKEQEIKEEISFLENRVDELSKELLTIKETIANLKDILWDKQSKKESSSMYKVLQGEKPYTEIQSDVGKVKVDGELVEKMEKHLDNPALRGMVTTQEFLSYPKVAKNVKAEYNTQQQGYDWKVKTNDENIIHYGERDYGEGHRLITTHLRTGRGERGHSHRQINDPNFHNPVDKIIPQKTEGNRKCEINSENTNRLLTNHSKTGYGERNLESGNGRTKSAPSPLFYDSDFRKSANDRIIPQSANNNQSNNIKEKITDFFKTQKNLQNSNHNKER